MEVELFVRTKKTLRELVSAWWERFSFVKKEIEQSLLKNKITDYTQPTANPRQPLQKKKNEWKKPQKRKIQRTIKLLKAKSIVRSVVSKSISDTNPSLNLNLALKAISAIF